MAASSGFAEGDRLVEAYLAAHEASSLGRELYDLHAADAPLIWEGALVPRARVPREGFALAHAAFGGQAWPAEAPALAWQPHGDRQLVGTGPWGSEPALQLQVGLERGTEGWLVAWALATDARQTPPGALGLARAFAEFPFLEAFGAEASTPLALSYRRHLAPSPPLLLLPGASFACQGSGDCCRAGMEITVPGSAQAFLDALPWSELAPEHAGTRLEARADGQLVLKRRQATCRFLNAEQRCTLHLHLGTPVFTPCVVFPYRFTGTPEGVAVTTSASCGAARGCVGPPLAEQREELQRRLQQAGGPMFAARPARLTRGPAADWEQYKRAEAALRDALDPADLARGLWAATHTLAALGAGEALPEAASATSGADVPVTSAEVRQLRASFDAVFALFAMLDPSLEAGAQLQGPLAPVQPAERLLARWCEQVYFAKDLAYEFGLATAHGLVVALCVFARGLMHAPGGFDAPRQRLLGNAVDHRLLIKPLWQLFELLPETRDALEDPRQLAALLRLAIAGPQQEAPAQAEATA